MSLVCQVQDQAFKGCLRDVKILKQQAPEEVWEELDWDNHVGRSVAKPAWEGCPFDLQKGSHFLGEGMGIVFFAVASFPLYCSIIV